MKRIEFDTNNKKPTLYNIAYLSIIVAALTALFMIIDAQRFTLPINIILVVYFAVVVILLMRAFVGQIRYNPYSYNTIYYTGFALFTFFVFLSHILVTIQMIKFPELYTATEIVRYLLGSAGNYMLITFPFLFLFSIALCVSNIALIRHEGRRLVNVLGIILSFLLVAGAVCIFRFNYYASGSKFEVFLHDLFGNFFSSVYLYFECMLIGSIVANAIAASYEPKPDKDFVLILGCRIRKDGSPTPLLRGRADRAVAFAKKQKELTGKDLVFIPSGGQGKDEVIAESASMKRYLISQGIPEEQIIEENRSMNTFENMKFSKQIVESINPDAKVAYSTTNYHVFRSGLYARRNKMRAVGMGAKTKWWFWPNAAVREFVGILKEHRGKQALIFGSMIAIYTILTILAYR